MDASRDAIDPWYWQRVQDARQMTPEDKLLAGARMFDYACEVTKAGIRSEDPSLSEEEVGRRLIERLRLGRRLETQDRWA